MTVPICSSFRPLTSELLVHYSLFVVVESSLLVVSLPLWQLPAKRIQGIKQQFLAS